jgi:hypothetical protein
MASADASNKVFIVLVMGPFSFAVIAARGRSMQSNRGDFRARVFHFFEIWLVSSTYVTHVIKYSAARILNNINVTAILYL